MYALGRSAEVMQIGRVSGVSGRNIWVEFERTPDLKVDDRVKVEVAKEKRSQSANAYFHVLCDKLRQSLRISFAECKNYLITSYGQIEYVDEGEPATIKTNIPADKMAQSEAIHCKPIFVAGTDAFWYRIYRGSHTYDSREMALLIDGTIEECKLQGIETLTPNELLRLEGYEK